MSGLGALTVLGWVFLGMSLAYLAEWYVETVIESGWFRRPPERARRVIDNEGKVIR